MSTTGLDVFDRTVQETNLWLKSLMEKLVTDDRHVAYFALRATMHALRDRIGPDNAVHLGAQLPMLIRGLYYEGWRMERSSDSRTPQGRLHRSFDKGVRRPDRDRCGGGRPSRLRGLVGSYRSRRDREGDQHVPGRAPGSMAPPRALGVIEDDGGDTPPFRSVQVRRVCVRLVRLAADFGVVLAPLRLRRLFDGHDGLRHRSRRFFEHPFLVGRNRRRRLPFRLPRCLAGSSRTPRLNRLPCRHGRLLDGLSERRRRVPGGTGRVLEANQYARKIGAVFGGKGTAAHDHDPAPSEPRHASS